jgi:soluble lytic murein transglycosylase
MNANVSKNALRAALALVVLFGGVVFEAASVGSATGGVPLPPKKPSVIQASLSAGSNADKDSTTSKPGTMSDDMSGVPVASPAYKMLHSTIRDELRQGRPSYALRLLERDPLAKNIKHSEYDRLRAAIAQSYMIEGKLTEARNLAELAVTRSGSQAPLAGWVGGLSAWRQKDFKTAYRHFSVVGNSPVAGDWLQSAGSFWASRAAYRSGQFNKVDEWLERAAQHPRTFYGLIAHKALDKDYNFNWSEPSLAWSQKSKLDNDPYIAEAFRQSGAGNVMTAISILSQNGWLKTRETREQVLAHALRKKQTALVMTLARTTRDTKGRLYDSALYPVATWEPQSGYNVDKALVYALIRQESRFNPHAKSGTGATGLMQLLPTTARYMNDGNDASLSVPEANIDLGQKYIRYLLNDNSVNNDLFKMMVAYNAGPGNLAKWKNQLKGVDDPLLFIESIPVAETRAFVERVMVNYWIYRIRMGQDTPSLDAIAKADQADYADAGRQHEDVVASKN